jgi:hydroxymethylbilane synthase
VIRLGTRASPLAQAQAQLAAEALAGQGETVELVPVETAGDRRAPDMPWGEGAFVGALERALLERRIDVAVHSAKDLPTAEDGRLRIAAFLPRADPRDALVVLASRRAVTLDGLPAGSTIGTDSPRRTGFLRARRPDLVVRPLHGNVDTRLRRLDEGAVDGLVLAAAGLARLGRANRVSELLAAEQLPPAPGQGAIALQVLAADRRLIALLERVDDHPTRHVVEVEREFLRATGGGCRAPVGGLATLEGDRLRLVAGFATLDGRLSATEELSGPADSGRELARKLAARLLARRAAGADRGQVIVTRPEAGLERLAARLSEYALAMTVVPAIEIRPPADPAPLRRALGDLALYSWLVVTSANGARAALEVARAVGIDLTAGRWAAIGRATASVLRGAGVRAAWQPSRATAAAIGAELPVDDATTVLLLRGGLADDELPSALRQRGAEVAAVTAYEVDEAPPMSRPLLEAALAGDVPSVLLLASPSAARGIVALAGDDLGERVRRLPALCIGLTTATAARAIGLNVVTEATSPEPGVLAEMAAALLADRAGGSLFERADGGGTATIEAGRPGD